MADLIPLLSVRLDINIKMNKHENNHQFEVKSGGKVMSVLTKLTMHHG